MDIGSFVRERRRAVKLTQQQLADKAGVGLNFVYQLEKNKSTVQLDCISQVLHALGFQLSVTPVVEPDAWDPNERAGARRLPWD